MRLQKHDSISVEARRLSVRPNSSIPGSSRFYRPELDAVRFLAFILVLLSHYLPNSAQQWSVLLSGRFAHDAAIVVGSFSNGLCLFFTLSAYLIVELLLREREASGTIQINQFYLRRILRIWPLYLVGLAIAAFLSLGSGTDKNVITWVGWSAVLLGNWYVVLHGDINSPMFPLWSISVEEQFYLFAPWMVKRLSTKSLAGFAVVLILVANALLFCAGIYGGLIIAPWFNSFVQFENFAAGILLCLFVRKCSIRMSTFSRLGFLLAAALCWIFASFWLDGVSGARISSCGVYMGSFALMSLGSCLVLLAFLNVGNKAVPQFSIYLGRISYGLYVYHMLAFKIALRLRPQRDLGNFVLRDLLAVGLTLGLAMLSYRYLESPFLRLKKHHEIVESRPI